MIKTKSLIVSGAIIIGISFLLLIYLGLIGLGIIHPKSSKLVVQTDSAEYEYTGDEHKKESLKIIEGELKSGDTFKVSYNGSQTDVGNSPNYASISILDTNLVDVTDKYDLDIQFGVITVNPVKVTFISANESKEFNQDYLLPTDIKIIGNLIKDHYYITEITSEIFLPGVETSTFFVKIFNAADEDVTNYYDITYIYGELTVERIPISVISNSLHKTFDGTALTGANTIRLSEKSHLLESHQIMYETTASIINVGSIENTFAVMILDQKGNDVTRYYDIEKHFGTLTIYQSIYSEDYLHLSSPNINKSDALLSFDTNARNNIYLRDFSYGNYDNKEFKWLKANAAPTYGSTFNTFNYTANLLQQLNYPTRQINLQFKRGQIPYLTPYHSNNNISNDVHNYGNIENNSSNINYHTSFYDVNVLNILDIIKGNINIEEVVYSRYVKDNYLQIDDSLSRALQDIAYNNGIYQSNDIKTLILSIKKYIEDQAIHDFEFDSLENSSNPILSFLNDSTKGLAQHFASAATLMYRAFGIPARYTTGYIYMQKDNKSSITEENVHAWVEVYVDTVGWIPIEVTEGFDKIEIDIQLDDAEKVYDGLPLTSDEFKILNGQLLDGHKIVVTTNGSQTEPGTSLNSIVTVKVIDYDNNDVSEQYNINTGKSSKLNVKKITLNEKLHVLTQTYSGSPFDFDNAKTPTVTGLLPGHFISSVTYTDLNYYTNVEESGNYHVTYTFSDGEKDVTHLYEGYGNSQGQLRFTPLSIIIQINDDIKEYDGFALVSTNQYRYLSGSLVNDHSMTITTKGSQTNIGSSVVELDDYQISSGSKDMKSNYHITAIPGILRVIPKRK